MNFEFFDKDVWFVVLGLVIFLISVFAIIIIKVRSRKSLLDFETNQSRFKQAVEKKENLLRSTPGALAPNIYKAMLVVFPILCGAAMFFLSKSFLITVMATIAGLFVPEVISRSLVNKEKIAFEERYGRALREMSSSLRAGMSIAQAVQSVCNSPFVDRQIRKEFQHIDSDIKIGKSVQEAFRNMADRANTPDTRDVAAAVAFQGEIGGSEADVIKNISDMISSRIAQRREIRSLFMGTTVTVTISSILPFIIFLACMGGMPEIKNYYLASPQNMLICVGLLLVMVMGVFITQKMSKNAKNIK